MCADHRGLSGRVPEKRLPYAKGDSVIAIVGAKGVAHGVPTAPRDAELPVYRPNLPAKHIAVVVRLSDFPREEPFRCRGSNSRPALHAHPLAILASPGHASVHIPPGMEQAGCEVKVHRATRVRSSTQSAATLRNGPNVVRGTTLAPEADRQHRHETGL
jgi:hypothetical protein